MVVAGGGGNPFVNVSDKIFFLVDFKVVKEKGEFKGFQEKVAVKV